MDKWTPVDSEQSWKAHVAVVVQAWQRGLVLERVTNLFLTLLEAFVAFLERLIQSMPRIQLPVQLLRVHNLSRCQDCWRSWLLQNSDK